MKRIISFLFLFISVLATFSLVCNLAAAIDTKGLVLYLTFDEGKGDTAKDASGNGNDGKLEGGAKWVKGKFGTAIFCEALPDRVVVPDSKTLDITDKITMEAWVFIEANPDTWNAILGKTDTYMIHSDQRGNQVGIEPLVWMGGSYGLWQTPANIPINFKEWHHVVGIFDGTEIRTYIDGELKGKVPRAGKIDPTDNPLVIGRDARGCCSGRKATHTIDEIRIWNRILTEAEIKEAMKGPETFLAVNPKSKLALTWGELKR